MKAILLAGGKGTRLRPLTVDLPKPMVPLFGRPVLEHLILLLRRHGITEIAMTLGYLPDKITDYFGDGQKWGVSITYFTEEQPLGTAGGVKACQSFLRGEDFIVLSGDCVCDFNLSDCISMHRQRQAEATILLHRVEDPTEYGLVQTDEAGRVIRFAEKPNWSQVFTDQVNTGIYLLQNSVLEGIPEHTVFDFSRDLFPTLLAQGRGLYADLPEGYWQDMGSCQSYRQTAMDALDGKLKLEMTFPQQQPGLYSDSLLPEDVTVLPPCWIGPDVTIEKDCLIGPYTVLEQCTRIGTGSVIQRSTLLGCAVGPGNSITASILCPQVQTAAQVSLCDSCALGSGVRVEQGATVKEQVRVWPGITVSSRSKLRSSVVSAAQAASLRFGEGGVLSGTLGQDMTPDLLLRLGRMLAKEGSCALGFQGEGAQALALAAQAGITSAGCDVLLHDGSTPSAAGWCAAFYHLPVSMFLWQREEQVKLYLFDQQGQALPSAQLRQLESGLQAWEGAAGHGRRTGKECRITGIDSGYLDTAVRWAGQPIPPLSVFASRQSPEGALLAEALLRMGCRLVREDGAIACYSQLDGFGLCLRTEQGRLLRPERVLLLSCLVLLEQGERTLALPSSAPALAERLAASYGASVLRLGRDGAEAVKHHLRLLPLRDGCAGACLLLGHLAHTGQSLDQLAARLPQFALRRREVALAGRAGTMEALSHLFPQTERLGGGIRVTVGSGSAWMSPIPQRSAVRIVTEGPTEEFAAELCDFITQKAKEADHL